MKINSRREARRRALQALYQWDLSGDSASSLIQQFAEFREMGGADPALFSTIVRSAVAGFEELDGLYSEFLDRRVEQMDPVERAILRLAVLELRDMPETPYRVVINEAVELAKGFGAEQSHKFINGVLDRCAGVLRAAEVSRKPKSNRRSGAR